MELRCVIVDDDDAFLQIAQSVLEQGGVTVAGVASSCAEAVERAGALRPDVVLIDIRLGDESGFEAARQLADNGQAAALIMISTQAEDSQANAKHAADALAAVPGLRHPRCLGELADAEILSCDGVFIPGGHGPMADLADNADVGRVLRLRHDAGKIVAAPCHGAAALLSAPDVDGAWMFDGFRMTAFTDEEEDQSKPGKIGMPWYQAGFCVLRHPLRCRAAHPEAPHPPGQLSLQHARQLGTRHASSPARSATQARSPLLHGLGL